MKIGILTFWWSEDNYGQQLQAYALQRYLRDAGHDAFLIRYNSLGDFPKNNPIKKIYKAFNPVKLVKFFINLRNKAKLKTEYNEHSRHFDEFRSKYINMSEHVYNNFMELQQNPPEADIYIVGSDQVWNPACCGGSTLEQSKLPLHAYFLDFGKESTKRMSYAASWGIKDLDESFVTEITPMLKRFNAITVREKSGTELCAKCGRNDSKWVCDPTLLLNAEEYRSLYKSENITQRQKPYLVFYYLNNGKFNAQSVYDFATSKGLDVVYITGNGVVDKFEKTYATVPEWLSLIDNAQYVITNSFHCCVFSILFHKQFASIKLQGQNAGMNERLTSLFELCKMEERYCTDRNFAVLEKDYESVLPDGQEDIDTILKYILK